MDDEEEKDGRGWDNLMDWLEAVKEGRGVDPDEPVPFAILIPIMAFL